MTHIGMDSDAERMARLRPSPPATDGLGDVLAVVIADPPGNRQLCYLPPAPWRCT